MFFIFPTGVDYRTNRLPMVTFVLMGLNTLIYLGTFLASLGVPGPEGVSAGELWVFNNLWLTPAEFKLHTYLTHHFVHAGLFHLLGNMMYLFLFGSVVEDTVGRAKYVLFYFLGAFGADVCYILFTPGHFASEIPMGGASGAISACMGGFACLHLRTRVNFRYIIFFFLRFINGEFTVPAWLVMSFYFLRDLLSGVLQLVGGESRGGVAFGAHIGGFATGAAMILLGREFFRHSDAETDTGPFLAAMALLPKGDIYILENDKQLGPYTPGTVIEMLRVKALNSKALYWGEGMGEWRPISELKR